MIFAFCLIALLELLLTAAYAMPSFVTEPRNLRSVIGDKAKFKLTFNGKPSPGIT